ncbi:hypothetical protein KR200_001074 [Drosophila serrata]|nr:hypothetical protein KR200_001074 [Drosophila serrata]
MSKYALDHLPKDRTQDLFKAYTIHENKYRNRNGIDELIPHKQFTFSKLWLLYAQFEIRSMELQRVRKALDLAIGMYPRVCVFCGYIDLEIQLREFERCRLLYEQFLEFGPEYCVTWMKFAELENFQGNTERSSTALRRSSFLTCIYKIN